MGMFDYVNCEYPLPGEPVLESARQFQTKDLECALDTYTITEDGQLEVLRWREGGDVAETLEHFTGEIVFYGSNWAASGPGQYTSDGNDLYSYEFKAVFTDGKLQSLVDVGRSVEPALDVREMPNLFTRPTPEESEARKQRVEESLMGREICVWWGGDTAEPYQAKVVAENTRNLVIESEQCGFEILHRSDRDRIFFDNQADGQAYKDYRKAEWDRRQKEFDTKIAAKNA